MSASLVGSEMCIRDSPHAAEPRITGTLTMCDAAASGPPGALPRGTPCCPRQRSSGLSSVPATPP
eukprot:457939-Alexandrium_andersonii.AAC.1